MNADSRATRADRGTNPLPGRLVTALLWLVATGMQLPGAIALQRFAPEPQAIRTAEGPAWGHRPHTRDRSLTLHDESGRSLGFLCAAPACWSNGIVDGVVARVTWIDAPVRQFGGDAPVPLKIVQRGKTLFESTAEDMIARAQRQAWIFLGVTQALFVLLGLASRLRRRQAGAHRVGLSREAAARRQAR